MVKVILGKVLKRKKISKAEFARRLGVHYTTVFQFFRPTYNPTIRTMEKWAKALKCKVRDLFIEQGRN